ncbi:MAG: Asp-tRNA(Asn)/Glu-tRNA(Gln) amidotransferase subunit GatA [Phycisphaerales bacterium]
MQPAPVPGDPGLCEHSPSLPLGAVVDQARSRISAAESLNAVLDVIGSSSWPASAAFDQPLGTPFPLRGLPVALKDNLCLGPDPSGKARGKTTCASRMLGDYYSPYSATAAQRLMDAGAVIVAKANMDEFAMGSSGENSAFGPTLNPWDRGRVPGGSSSGSAALVAAGVVPVALGSDTGGSIRQPAGFCNLVGVKPTYGRVSRYGLVAYASSLDQVGTLSRTVEEAALVLGIISGYDPADTTSLDIPVPDFTRDLEVPVPELVLGIPTEARSASNHPAVRAALENAAFIYRSLGATIVEVELPHIEHAIAAYYIIATAEASSNLARFDGVRYGRRASLSPGEDLFDLYARSRAEGFGAEVQRRIMLGTYVLSAGYYDAYYNTALKTRRLIKGDYDAAFRQGVHAILMPTSPGPAFKLGEKTSDPMAMYLEDIYTVGVNLAGLPAVAVPAGFASVGESAMEDANLGHDESPKGLLLPVGIQLIGPAMGEAELLRIARMFERETRYAQRHPPLWVGRA